MKWNFSMNTTFKNNLKIYTIAIIPPIINMVVFLLEFYFTYPFNDPTHHPIMWSEAIGFYALIFIIPAIMIGFSLTPEKHLKNKKELLKILGLMGIFGWILIVFSYRLAGYILSIKT